MRTAYALILIAGICGDIATGWAADGPTHLACGTDAGVQRLDLGAEAQDLRFTLDADHAWLEIRESRQTVTITSATIGDVIEIPLPLRFGSHWLLARRGEGFAIKRFLPGDADGSVAVTVHCGESPELQRHVD